MKLFEKDDESVSFGVGNPYDPGWHVAVSLKRTRPEIAAVAGVGVKGFRFQLHVLWLRTVFRWTRD